MVDQNSSFWDRLINSLSGHGYIDGTTWEQPQGGSQQPGMDQLTQEQYQRELAMAQQNMQPMDQLSPGQYQQERQMAQQNMGQGGGPQRHPGAVEYARRAAGAGQQLMAGINKPIGGAAPIIPTGFHGGQQPPSGMMGARAFAAGRGFSPQPNVMQMLMAGASPIRNAGRFVR